MTDTDKLVPQIDGDDDHDAVFGQSEAGGHNAGRGDVLGARDGRGHESRAELAHDKAHFAAAGLLAARAKAIGERRIRHPDRCTARPVTAPPHSVLVLVAEWLRGGMHG
jgi:hypothetical protein